MLSRIQLNMKYDIRYHMPKSKFPAFDIRTKNDNDSVLASNLNL